MKKMTTYQMWKFLEKLFRAAYKNGVTSVSEDVVKGRNCLCHCVYDLFLANMISIGQNNKADREIIQESKRIDSKEGAYVWSLDTKGARLRSLFCRRMANKYAPKKGVTCDRKKKAKSST